MSTQHLEHTENITNLTLTGLPLHLQLCLHLCPAPSLVMHKSTLMLKAYHLQMLYAEFPLYALMNLICDLLVQPNLLPALAAL
jgi:hypothetical protein